MTGSILGLPLSGQYFSSTSSYIKVQSMALSIKRSIWFLGTISSIQSIIICSLFLSEFFVIIENTALLIFVLYQKNGRKHRKARLSPGLCLQSETSLSWQRCFSFSLDHFRRSIGAFNQPRIPCSIWLGFLTNPLSTSHFLLKKQRSLLFRIKGRTLTSDDLRNIIIPW